MKIKKCHASVLFSLVTLSTSTFAEEITLDEIRIVASKASSVESTSTTTKTHTAKIETPFTDQHETE